MAEEDKTCNTLPDGSVIDLDAYDWGDAKLNKRQKLFIIWYTTPNQKAFMSPSKAARKAGYNQKTSYIAKYQLIQNRPDIQALIKKFTDTQIKVSVKEATDKFIMQKIARASYNVSDFYQTQEFTTETGTKKITSIKPLEELTEEQASIIDNVSVNNVGIATYQLPNRDKEINDIIKLNQTLNPEKSETDEFDVETTISLIKDNLATVKTTIKKRNQEIREAAGEYIETSENQPDFD